MKQAEEKKDFVLIQTADVFKAIVQRVFLQHSTKLPRETHAPKLFSSQFQLRENTKCVLLQQISQIRRKKRGPPPQIHTDIATRARYLNLSYIYQN